MVGRHPPLQHLLREGGAIVRLVRLIPDDGQGPAEALVAQGFGGAEPRQGGADDDDPAVGLKVRYQGRYHCRGAHDVAPSSVSSSRSTRIACTGQDAAARRTRWRCESSGLGSYMSASSPCSWKTSGASGTHCAYPRHRFRSTTRRILPLLLRLLPPTLASPRGGWSKTPSMLQPAWPAAVLSTLARGGASCLKTHSLIINRDNLPCSAHFLAGCRRSPLVHLRPRRSRCGWPPCTRWARTPHRAVQRLSPC